MVSAERETAAKVWTDKGWPFLQELRLCVQLFLPDCPRQRTEPVAGTAVGLPADLDASLRRCFPRLCRLRLLPVLSSSPRNLSLTTHLINQ